MGGRRRGGGTPGPAILLVGDDAGAKAVVEGLLRDARFVPVDAGPLAAGRLFQSPDAPLDDVRLSPEDLRVKLADRPYASS